MNRLEFYHCNGKEFQVRRHHSESDYESFLLEILRDMNPDYFIFPFKTNIFANSDYGNKQADLVFIHREYIDWVVVEVELSHHSLNSHVFPQAFTFKNGEYNDRHVRYLSGKYDELDEEKLHYLMVYNPPEVLVIVDSMDVYNRGWERLEEVSRIAVAVPLRDQYSNYALHYVGWRPESRTETTAVSWNRESTFIEVHKPSAVFSHDVERCVILLDGRQSDWVVRKLRDSLILFPIQRWVDEHLSSLGSIELSRTEGNELVIQSS